MERKNETTTHTGEETMHYVVFGIVIRLEVQNLSSTAMGKREGETDHHTRGRALYFGVENTHIQLGGVVGYALSLSPSPGSLSLCSGLPSAIMYLAGLVVSVWMLLSLSLSFSLSLPFSLPRGGLAPFQPLSLFLYGVGGSLSLRWSPPTKETNRDHHST